MFGKQHPDLTSVGWGRPFELKTYISKLGSFYVARRVISRLWGCCRESMASHGNLGMRKGVMRGVLLILSWLFTRGLGVVFFVGEESPAHTS